MQVEEIIVADSSPLIGLARIGRLEILPQLARRIVIPPAVWNEIVNDKPAAPGARAVAALKWIEIQQPDDALVAILESAVDRGEAEAIALAMRCVPAVLLMDDLHARRVAAKRALRVIGTVGLLMRAKQAGLVGALRPLLDGLVANGIHLDRRLRDAALGEVGES